MNKEKVLSTFLRIPLVDKLTIVVIGIFFKKQKIKTVFTSFKNSIFGTRNNESTSHFKWVILISAPSGEESKYWGDTYFAQELVKSFNKMGQDAKIIYRDQNPNKFIEKNTIQLCLRGLFPMEINKKCLNLIWVISHPDQIGKRELTKYDGIFAASHAWALEKSKQWNLEIKPLLQATNPELFKITSSNSAIKSELLFVGNTRGQFRQSVKIASSCPKHLTVIGSGWENYLPKSMINSNFISNDSLPELYQNSDFVLADHWQDMSKNGFISNRLFDAVSCGARVITDYVPGISDIFGDSVVEFKNTKDLEILLNQDLTEKFGDIESRVKNAQTIQTQHNFDLRAKELTKLAQHLVKK